MGIISNLIRGQFIDVIEWLDPTTNTVAHRYDRGGKEIMMGAQLTVRESQVAVMVNEGQIADVFGPGRYELQTQNMPIMTALQSWKYGFNSPFKAEVYFINTKQFIDQKWGTSNPVMMRDTEFGVVRLLAHGNYSFVVSDPKQFLKQILGTKGDYTTQDIAGQIKRIAVSGLSDALAQSKIPALDLAANYDELGGYALSVLSSRLEPYGIRLTSFVIENITVPENVEKAMDERTSMGVVGDLGKYTQFQAAAAMREAANNPNGAAGLGAGFGAAAMMGQVVNQAMQQPAAPAAKPAAQAYCRQCGFPLPAGAKFCSQCGAQQGQSASVCPQCGHEIEPGAKFCPQCGARL